MRGRVQPAGALLLAALVGSTVFSTGCETKRLGAGSYSIAFPPPRVEPPPPNALGRVHILCTRRLEAWGIDAAKENAQASATAKLAATLPNKLAYDAIIVPGYTPVDATAPQPSLHPIARERLDLAASDLRAGAAALIIVSGGNANPPGTPFNEAMMMKGYLLASGIPEAQIAIEPCALHSHTNLRNAGRFLLAHGLSRALIVTSVDQAFYFGYPDRSTFDARCLLDFGTFVGELRPVDRNRVAFRPNGRVFDLGRDIGDP